jgi:hypothetical protein
MYSSNHMQSSLSGSNITCGNYGDGETQIKNNYYFEGRDMKHNCIQISFFWWSMDSLVVTKSYLLI